MQALMLRDRVPLLSIQTKFEIDYYGSYGRRGTGTNTMYPPSCATATLVLRWDDDGAPPHTTNDYRLQMDDVSPPRATLPRRTTNLRLLRPKPTRRCTCQIPLNLLIGVFHMPLSDEY